MVKVAIVDGNRTYLERLHDYWSKTYGSGAVIVVVFPDYQQFFEFQQKEKIDILLINNQLEAELELLPKRMLKVYLLPGKKSGVIKGIQALPKNGNADELYRNLMELYDEHMNVDRVTLPGQMLFFTSPEGGSGTSSCAIGCGKYLVSLGKKTLYLNLENINALEMMLDGETKQGMEELLYLCKTNRKNISVSIDGITGTDRSGLKYIAGCKNPMGLKDMTVEDMKKMITMVTEKGAFDFVIVDRGFSLEQITGELMAMAHRVILVFEPGPVGRKKLEYTKAFLEEADKRGVPVGSKIRLLYNRASGMEASAEILGSLPPFAGMDARQITTQMGACTVFGELLLQDE